MDFFNRTSDARDQMNRVTPLGLTPEQRMGKLLLFTAPCGMRSDDPLRRQLVSQKNVCLGDVTAAFVPIGRLEYRYARVGEHGCRAAMLYLQSPCAYGKGMPSLTVSVYSGKVFKWKRRRHMKSWR